MNINFVIECETCKKETDCRVGMSNRDVQPFRFCCQTCGSPIDFTLHTEKAMEIKGGVYKSGKKIFDGTNSFVDLHLDFPVRYGKYVMGHTPFFAALELINADNDEERMAMYGYFSGRLNELNALYPKADQIRNLIRLYADGKNEMFKEKTEYFLQQKFKSLQPEDINACLYMLISTCFGPMVQRDSVKDLVAGLTELIRQLAENLPNEFNSFMEFLFDTSFIKQLQLDCLELYPEVLDAELPLRPALFLDLVKDYDKGMIAARVSTDKFADYKDLYKDISEVLSRQLVIVAGINNLTQRGDCNAFAEPAKGTGKKPSSLNEYADKPYGEKLAHLDDCWYKVDKDVVDNRLRNAIAHFKAEYDEVTQIVTYFPNREGLHQEKAETMYFLDFMRKILASFREMHYLHHLIKCLFFYYYLIYKKRLT